MSDTTAIRRQLKIKSGVVKRLLKEHNMYRKEMEQQQRRVDRYIADGADEWDIKTQQKLLLEAQKMVPDSETRLGAAVAGLRDVVVGAKAEPGLAQDEELMRAEEALEEASV